MAVTTMQDLLSQLANDLKVDSDFATDKPGLYSIPFEEDTTVEIIELQQGILFTAVICPVPGKKQEDFYTQALLGNLFGQGTLGSVVGITADGKNVAISREIPKITDYKNFRNNLEDFLNALDFWRDEARQRENS